MMNELVYSFRENKVRVIEIDGSAWFVAKDVCEVLELSNPTMAVGRLDEDEVTKFNLGGLSGETNIVNEYGLYSLILGSRKQEAKEFKRWVTHEVLPSIRKTGSYNMPTTYKEALLALVAQVEKNEELEKTVAIQAPKAEYADVILSAKGAMLVTQIAKDYGMSAVKFNRLLHELGVQHYVRNQWVLYSKYDKYGYIKSSTGEYGGYTRTTTQWTQKGRMFLYELLKKNSILPITETQEEK